MAQTNVMQFAKELGLPAELLLEQLKAAGVNKSSSEDVLAEQDKAALLEHLRKGHGLQQPKNKITLTRKQVSEIKQSTGAGRGRTVQVEVKKKRVLVRRDTAAEHEEQVESAIPAETVATIAEGVLVKPAVVVEKAAVVLVQEKESIHPAKSAPLLDAEQVAKRGEEARRQAELIALQGEEKRKKQELIQKKQEAEARKTAEEDEAKKKLSEGTLHKPAGKPGEKPKGAEAKAKKGAPGEWSGDAKRRSGLKTRGDVGIGQGWRAPGRSKAGRHHKEVDSQHAFSAPTEPIVHEVLVPETISVADLAHKMAVKAAEVIKVLMKMGDRKS